LQDVSEATSSFDIKEEELSAILAHFSHLNALIASETLADVHTLKPLLDGKQVCDLYSIKPGKAIKFIMDEQLRWQVVNPGKGIAEVSQWLTEKKDEMLAKYA
jgi:tRNA nucleotidyltransferase (CCA-adding enzyme)